MTENRIFKSNEISSLEDTLLPIKNTFKTLDKGKNILIQTGNKISLLKYYGVEIGNKDPLLVRMNRHTSIQCMNFLFPENKDDPYIHKDLSKRIIEKARLEILGTHRLDFTLDEEFDFYMPSANDNTDLYLTLAQKYGDGRIEPYFDEISTTIDEKLIIKKLKEITKPNYFEQNILPFVENRETNLEMPKWNSKINFFKNLMRKKIDKRKPTYLKFNSYIGKEWLSNVAKDLSFGNFVYVGSKEQVYLLGVAKNHDGSLYNQGTYTTSTKPMLWFSNNYLGHMNNFDMQRPLFKGNGPCNVAEYRTSNPPSFNGNPYIFSAIGRNQCCKNSIFSGEPQLITGDLSEALDHLKTTDFNEFEDVVKLYSQKINEPTPNAKPNGKYFF
jgi:hypothetical protein